MQLQGFEPVDSLQTIRHSFADSLQAVTSGLVDHMSADRPMESIACALRPIRAALWFLAAALAAGGRLVRTVSLE